MNRKTLLTLVLSSVMANAQYDGFNYTGAITENGWSDAGGGNNIIATANGLSYPNLNVLGGKVSLSATIGSPPSYLANFAYSTPTTTTAYASFLLKVVDITNAIANDFTFPSSMGYFMYLVQNVEDVNGVSRIGIRKGSQSGTFNIGIQNITGGMATSSDIFGTNPIDFQLGETYFVVLKYDMTGNKGLTSIWVNPNGSETTPVTHTSNFGSGAKKTKISALRLRQAKNNMPSVEVDEIRLGSTWADVVPSSLSIQESKISDKKFISNTLVKEDFRVLQDSKVEIYSSIGALVKVGNYTANQDVNVSNLTQGVYLVKITTQNTTKILKIIKQ